jgi:hypothetical protein
MDKTKYPYPFERWVIQGVIGKPSILGLGDVVVTNADKMQVKKGRNEFILLDAHNKKQYEVELITGKMSDTGLVRAIEFWSKEKHRSPHYKHCAVIVVADISKRFIDVIKVLKKNISIKVMEYGVFEADEIFYLVLVKILE